MNEDTARRLTELSRLLYVAKAAENMTKRKRIEIEEEIAKLVPIEKGQRTINLPDGSAKITVSKGRSYRTDIRALKGLFKNSRFREMGFPSPFKTKEELDIEGYEWYRKHHPEVFTLMAKHVEIKPGKVSVSVKLKNEA